MIKIRKLRAIISVTDKTGVVEFAKGLAKLDFEIISTGGTGKALQEAQVPFLSVEEVTGFPEMMDGRLKTLHPKIMGGILADRTKPSHLAALKEHGIELIDMVVVNLYDFEGNPSIERIDVGGPSMLRAAAKNYEHVVPVMKPSDYALILGQLRGHGSVSLATRLKLAEEVFKSTSAYDMHIAFWFSNQTPASA